MNWHSPVISATQETEQKDCKLKASPRIMVRPHLSKGKEERGKGGKDKEGRKKERKNGL